MGFGMGRKGWFFYSENRVAFREGGLRLLAAIDRFLLFVDVSFHVKELVVHFGMDGWMDEPVGIFSILLLAEFIVTVVYFWTWKYNLSYIM